MENIYHSLAIQWAWPCCKFPAMLWLFLTELIFILVGIVSFDSILVLTHPDTLIFFSHLYSYIENWSHFFQILKIFHFILTQNCVFSVRSSKYKIKIVLLLLLAGGAAVRGPRRLACDQNTTEFVEFVYFFFHNEI